MSIKSFIIYYYNYSLSKSIYLIIYLYNIIYIRSISIVSISSPISTLIYYLTELIILIPTTEELKLF